MSRLRLGWGATALTIFALAGCGGGDDDATTAAATTEATEAASLSKEELVAQGNAICAEVNAAVGAVGSTSADAAGRAQQVAGLYGGMVGRLKELGAPSDESAGYAETISAGEALAQAEDDVRLAAEREEGEAEAGEDATAALTAFQTAAADFGLDRCAEAPSAPAPSAGGEEGGEEASGGVEPGGEEAAPEEAEAAPEAGGAGAAEEESAGGGVGSGGSSGGIGPG